MESVESVSIEPANPPSEQRSSNSLLIWRAGQIVGSELLVINDQSSRNQQPHLTLDLDERIQNRARRGEVAGHT